MENWKQAFEARDDLKQYEDNAIGLFALALNFGLEDLDAVAAEGLTDGSDDKKCDLVYINKDDGIAIVMQCYMAAKMKSEAPANKAADLNTAMAWLLQRSVSELPMRIRAVATELRHCIEEGKVTEIRVWYVHNLKESKNVKTELHTVESTIDSIVNTHFRKKIKILSQEIGTDTLKALYEDTFSPILVSDTIKIPVENGFEIETDSWSAYVTAMPGNVLRRLYRNPKYKERLFSANIRDYLGSRKTDANINNGIKETAEKSPSNFWAFNNGLTILTNDYKYKNNGKGTELTIKGLSIVNGAQTTGALGTLRYKLSDEVLVPARFIKTVETDVIHNIIQFNNSQNKITAADFRSTDRIQKRLREEMASIPNAEYEGGRRGGYQAAIKRRPNLIPSYSAGQALAAFHKDPISAYNNKSKIWVLPHDIGKEKR